MKQQSWHVWSLLLVTMVALGTTLSAAPDPADPLVGNWLYWKGQPVTFSADGTANWPKSGHHGGYHGTWEYLHNSEVQRHYRIAWEHGKSIDNLTLAEDGKHAHVANEQSSSHPYNVRRALPDKAANSDTSVTSDTYFGTQKP